MGGDMTHQGGDVGALAGDPRIPALAKTSSGGFAVDRPRFSARQKSAVIRAVMMHMMMYSRGSGHFHGGQACDTTRYDV